MNTRFLWLIAQIIINNLNSHFTKKLWRNSRIFFKNSAEIQRIRISNSICNTFVIHISIQQKFFRLFNSYICTKALWRKTCTPFKNGDKIFSFHITHIGIELNIMIFRIIFFYKFYNFIYSFYAIIVYSAHNC